MSNKIKEKKKKEEKVKVEVIGSATGSSLYINDFRVCGNKPWGGGTVIRKWVTSKQYILKALKKE